MNKLGVVFAEEIGIVGFGTAEEVMEIVGFAKIVVVVLFVVLSVMAMIIQNVR